ncbi:ABC transporter permease [Caulobacter sp. KR2-114]|uniref:ABC transporter permease n=1 Tax=Caulobacter sp. KR2-114 TaxID=3400912 RepID=UPI003C116E5D
MTEAWEDPASGGRAGDGRADGWRVHLRIIWALMLRELSTRYGRDNIGFLWVVAEPLLFAAGVLALWGVARPPYEHGLRVLPFVITGYMPIILVRHMISHGMNCVRANRELLYHRQIAVLHLFFARLALEFVGVSLAFVVIFVLLNAAGQMDPPARLYLVYAGWVILAWTSFGLALIFGALAEMFDYVERFVSVITYILVPLSGTFYMAAWLPPGFRRMALYLPFLHSVEMIRGGFFGEFTPTYFDPTYACAWAAGFTVVGLALARGVRDRVEIE